MNNITNPHLFLQIARFCKAGKYLIPLLASLFLIAACGGGGGRTQTAATPPPNPCIANPFGTNCTSPEAIAAREAKINECLMGDAATTPTCANAVLANPCLLDPFAAGCEQNVEFIRYLAPARTARITLCAVDANLINAACMQPGVMAVTDTCKENPFADTCDDYGTQYETAQTMRRQVCERPEAERGGADCSASIATFCATIDAAKFVDSLCSTEVSNIVRGAYCVSLNGVLVPEACGDDTEDDSLVRAYCASDRPAAYDDNINCATTIVANCPIRPFNGNGLCGDAFNVTREGLCRGPDRGLYPCGATIVRFCETAAETVPDNVLDTLCATGTYTVERQTACDGIFVTSPQKPLCRPVFDALCIPEPFNPTAGAAAGTARFNCLESTHYVQWRIEFCDNPETSFHADCRNMNVLSGLSYVSFLARRSLVETCVKNRNSVGCDSVVSGDLTVVGCIDDPLNTSCMIKRCSDTSNPYCIDDVFASTRLTLCTTPETSFTAACSDYLGATEQAVNVARGALAEVCAGDPTATGCDTDISGGFTVANCSNHIIGDTVGNPFQTACVNASVNASFVNERKGRAIACSEADTSEKAALGCTTTAVGTLTVDGCIATPFHADCAGEAFVFARLKACLDAQNPTNRNTGCNLVEGSRTRYVQAGATELDTSSVTLVEDKSETTSINEATVIIKDTLTLEDIETGGDNTTGIAFAYTSTGGGITIISYETEFGRVNGPNVVRPAHYAGLLSGTDVGAALTEAPADATWHGKVAIVNSIGSTVLTEEADFVLTIDFANKTLDSGVIDLVGGQFVIDAKFSDGTSTDAGFIYGTTSLSDGFRGGIVSRGSVTGLIGADAAVGVFISSGAGRTTNTFGEYAGGFVASPTAPDPVSSCSHPDNLLNVGCIAADAQYYDVCVTTAIINGRRTREFCEPIVERYIDRETECADQKDILNNLTKPLCEPVIAQLCDFNSGNIFKTDAGTGDAKFNCMSITRYSEKRAQICRIPAYANGAIVELDGVVYRTKPIAACGAVISGFCDADPFAQTNTRRPVNLCDSSYNTARETTCAQDIIAVVSAGAGVASNRVSAANAAPNRCFDTITRACTANPFDTTLCSASNVNFLALRVHACILNPSVSDTCTAIISTNCPASGTRHAECRSDNFQTWVADSGISANSVPENETENSRILLGRSIGLDTANVTSFVASQTVLRFSEEYDIHNDGSKITEEGYESGVAFFSAESSGQTRYYAGILSGSDTGLPLTDPNVITQWNGKIGWVSGSDRFAKLNTQFLLKIDFNTRTISHSGIADRAGRGTDRLSLTAIWDATNGVLTGTTTLNRTVENAQVPSTGALTGFIGNRGVVAVFDSDETQAADGAVHYAGGLVATPNRPPAIVAPVAATDTTWAARFHQTGRANVAGDVLLTAGNFTRTGRAADSSHFIEAGGNGLGLRSNDISPVYNRHNTPEYFLRLDGTTAAIGATAPSSGAVFWAGFIRDNVQDNVGVAHLYAGLLPGTDVGLPLPQGTGAMHNGAPSATWTGTISGIFRGTGLDMIGEGAIAELTRNGDRLTDTGFQLLVDFGAGTIKTPAGEESFGNLKLSLDGAFDIYGVMTGAVALAPTESALMNRGAGRFGGVIGVDGAVGVFKSNNDAIESNSYIGGFVATPPAPSGS